MIYFNLGQGGYGSSRVYPEAEGSIYPEIVDVSASAATANGQMAVPSVSVHQDQLVASAPPAGPPPTLNQDSTRFYSHAPKYHEPSYPY